MLAEVVKAPQRIGPLQFFSRLHTLVLHNKVTNELGFEKNKFMNGKITPYDCSVRTAACQFRTAIDALDRKLLPATFADFPHGACGETSMLLGSYFIETGVGTFQYVSGERGRGAFESWRSHAWLEKDGLVVDVTADQFDDAPQSIIVQRDSAWHAQFSGEKLYDADYRTQGFLDPNSMRNLYSDILQKNTCSKTTRCTC